MENRERTINFICFIFSVASDGKLISVDPFDDQTKLLAKASKSKEEGKKSPSIDVSKLIRHVDLYSFKDRDIYRQAVSDSIQLYEDGLITAHISKKFKLTDVKDAIDFIKKKKCTGKVLIDVESIKQIDD